MQGQLFQQNEPTAANRRVFLWLVDATDAVSPKTGVTGTGYVTKNGGTPAATSGSLVEVDATNLKGLYYITLTSTEVNTLGPIVVGYQAAGVLASRHLGMVVPFDPYTVDKTGFSLSTAGIQAIWDALTANLTTAGSVGKRLADNIDAQVSLVPTALLDLANAIETGLTPRNALRLIAAAAAGVASGVDTATAIYKSAVSGTKNRITATVDTNGNRSSITTDLT